MKTRLICTTLVIAVLALIGGVILYLRAPLPVSTAAPELVATKVAESPQQHGAEMGTMETVTTPPRPFNGHFSPGTTNMEDFSSNPKRDPEEQRVLDIAAQTGVTDQAKVQQLLALLPSLPPDAQTLAMENATALIPDTDYLNYRNHLIQLAKTPDLREAVMNDSLTRGEELRLPNLLELMRTSQSENEKMEIRGILEAYLDKDYGPQPAQWEAPLRQWIAENQ